MKPLLPGCLAWLSAFLGLSVSAGCAEPERPAPWMSPAEDALACDGFAFAPADGEARCAASKVVDGVAIEKAWRRVPGSRTGRPLEPDDPSHWEIQWTLLLQGAQGWERQDLMSAACGGEVPAGCSHDEMFRREFAIARDGERLAVSAPSVYDVGEVPPRNNSTAALVYLVDGGPPYVLRQALPGEASALLASGPPDLSAAYLAEPPDARALSHAAAAWRAGVSAPRDALLAAVAAQPDMSSLCGPLVAELGSHPDERWVFELLGRPACRPNLAQPMTTAPLLLPTACRAALERCGLDLDANVSVSVYGRNDRTNIVSLGEGPPLYLGEQFGLYGQVDADTAIFVTPRSCPAGRLRSRTAVVWLGEPPVDCTNVEAPLVIVPEPGGPPGACTIPAGVCPALPE